MSNRRKLRTSTRQRLHMPIGDIRLATGQLLIARPPRGKFTTWLSPDGLTVTATFLATPKGRILTACVQHTRGYPTGHELDAVTKAFYPDDVSVGMTLNEESPAVHLYELGPAQNAMHVARSA